MSQYKTNEFIFKVYVKYPITSDQQKAYLIFLRIYIYPIVSTAHAINSLKLLFHFSTPKCIGYR